MAKGKAVPGKAKGGSEDKILKDSSYTTFIIAVIMGLILTVSIGVVIFTTFGEYTLGEKTLQNGEAGQIVTPLGFDLALLMIIMVSVILMILFTRERYKAEKGRR